MSETGNRLQFRAAVTFWTTTTFLISACSSVVLTGGYGHLGPNGGSTVQLLIHDNYLVPGEDRAYSWSFSWMSTGVSSVLAAGGNRIEDYVPIILPHNNFIHSPRPPPPQSLRFAGYGTESHEGWVGLGHHWNGQYEICENGQRQSPVAIQMSSLKVLKHEYPALKFDGYWNRPESNSITNDGHTIKLLFKWPRGMQPTISGGPLNGEYMFWQLHFHWGSRNSIGSEHKLDNSSFPMEMHVVHYKKKYGSPMAAMNYKDGLAVLAYFFEISDFDDLGISSVVKDLHRVSTTEEHEVTVGMSDTIDLADIAPPFSKYYITYQGSLTTPPCSEIVTWIISTDIKKISLSQMEAFRTVLTPEGIMGNNFRTPQPLNNRLLYLIV